MAVNVSLTLGPASLHNFDFIKSHLAVYPNLKIFGFTCRFR